MNRELLRQALDYIKETYDFCAVMQQPKEREEQLIKALETELAKPEQEPVAYRHLHEDGYEYYDAPTGIDCNECESLYTAPPRKPWVGLTDDEVYEIANFCKDQSFSFYAKEIENKLKEKNA